jgi:sporulation protein YlmC with PRC-barrel domain
MLDTHTAIGWRGYELVDRDGDKIGSISEIYLDRETNQPEWATVKTGLFGLRQTFVPIRDATSEGNIVRIPFEKDHVKDAPNVDPDEELSQSEERQLYEHYGVDYSKDRSSTQPAEHGGAPGQEPAPEERRAGDEGPRDAGDEDPGDAGDGGRRDAGDGGRRDAGDEDRHDAGDEDRSPSPEEGERGVAVPGQSDDDAEAARDPGRDRLEQGTITERISEEPAGQGGGDALRLKRYVVTEEVRVPVQREELRIERDE